MTADLDLELLADLALGGSLDADHLDALVNALERAGLLPEHARLVVERITWGVKAAREGVAA